MPSLKGKHAVVLGGGSNIKKYWNKIENFIKGKNIVTIGCNHISDIYVPDIHFWGSGKRFKKYGHLTSKKSSVVFQSNFSRDTIKKYWKGDYAIFDIEPVLWKYGSDDKSSYQYQRCCIRRKKGVIYGCFCSAGSKAILLAYLNGAKKISVVGMDGYTFYTKKSLKEGDGSQNFYGRGMSSGFTYLYSRKVDWDIYKTLREICDFGKKKYGFKFEIITPTIYEEFYNSKVLGIKRDPLQQEWKEPTEKEYKKLYFESRKDRKLKGKQYSDYNG